MTILSILRALSLDAAHRSLLRSEKGKDMFSQPSVLQKVVRGVHPARPETMYTNLYVWKDFIAPWNKCCHYLLTMVPNHDSDLNPILTATIKPHFHLKQAFEIVSISQNVFTLLVKCIFQDQRDTCVHIYTCAQ